MSQVIERSKIDDKYKWNLADLYPGDEAWEADFAKLEEALPRLRSYKGKMKDSAVALKALNDINDVSVTLERLYVYAHCRKDEDTTNDKYVALNSRVSSLAHRMSAAISYINPELTALPAAELKARIENKAYADYDYILETLIKSKKHILSEKEEKLLAMSGEFAGDFSNIFTMIDNADLDRPEIEVEGSKVTLTHGTYGVLLQHEDKSVRRDAYNAYYNAYRKLINTIAANYHASVKKNAYYAKARKYKGCLEMAVAGENVPGKVYNMLVAAVNKNLKTLHKYIKLRKKALKVKEYHMYDMYAPIVADADLKLEFDDAAKLVTEGLKPLGKEYGKLLDRAFSERWIDVYETKNKRSGGYCTSAHGTHPYILLNYTKTTREVFTIAHELGHAMHSYYSSERLPYAKAQYEIFVAEVASTVNEMLLLEHLLKNADGAMRKYLLSYKLDSIRTTLFRQTMFAEFEKEAHERVEKGVPLTPANLSELYGEINARYYGPAISYDDNISYEWARIPHFYRAFYVYKYATGITCAINIAERILKGEQGFLERYMEFLAAGGSKSPYDILKDLGIDLCTAEPYNQTMKVFADTVDELKELI